MLGDNCAFPGCGRPVVARGLCGAHYAQHRAGHELHAVRYSSRGLSTREKLLQYRVDKNGCWTWTGALHTKGYGIVRIGGRQVLAHRASYEEVNGPVPDGLMLDHICHNRACINPTHLHPVTNKQNMENPAALSRHNTSGCRGVSRVGSTDRWVAFVTHHGRTHHVGTFGSAAEAGEAAARKRLELFTNNLHDRAHTGAERRNRP